MRTRPAGYPSAYPVFGVKSVVLEGFETFSGGVPDGGIIPWYTGNIGTPMPLVSSNLHVTQGIHSGLWDGDAALLVPILNAGEDIGGDVVDLSGYSQILIDVYVAEIDPAGALQMNIYDTGSFDEYSLTPTGETGAFTLSINLSSAPDKSNLNISIVALTGVETEIYMDNLRGYLG